ncbi:MAG: hypothetical protein ABW221_05025 [Vicinamibacteria bacterium]
MHLESRAGELGRVIVQSSLAERDIKLIMMQLAAPGDRRWHGLPSDGPWLVDFDRACFVTNKPLLALASILVEHLNGAPSSLWDVVDTLDDIRDLINCWMIESPFTDVFAAPTADDPWPRHRDGIWRIVERLCNEALGSAALGQTDVTGLTLALVLDAHCVRLAPQQVEAWRPIL